MAIVGVVVFCGAALVAMDWWLSGNLCANTVLKAETSPSGRKTVVVFERDCGATTDFSTQVSVFDSAKLSDRATGNVLVTDGRREGIDVRWSDETTLVVTGAGDAHWKVDALEDITVVYR